MARNRENGSSEQPFAGRVCLALWKRITLAVITVALLVGFSGCALEDLLAPFAGDVPFEQDVTMPSEMGAVDNVPTVPDDDSAMDLIRPLT